MKCLHDSPLKRALASALVLPSLLGYLESQDYIVLLLDDEADRAAARPGCS